MKSIHRLIGLAVAFVVVLGGFAATTGSAQASPRPAPSSPSHVSVRASALATPSAGRAQRPSPSAYSCDFYTHQCIKFSKSETRKVASHSNAITGASSFPALFCGVAGGYIGIGACAAMIQVVVGSLMDSFDNAASAGKCVELHMIKVLNALDRWKTISC